MRTQILRTGMIMCVSIVHIQIPLWHYSGLEEKKTQKCFLFILQSSFFSLSSSPFFAVHYCPILEVPGVGSRGHRNWCTSQCTESQLGRHVRMQSKCFYRECMQSKELSRQSKMVLLVHFWTSHVALKLQSTLIIAYTKQLSFILLSWWVSAVTVLLCDLPSALQQFVSVSACFVLEQIKFSPVKKNTVTGSYVHERLNKEKKKRAHLPFFSISIKAYGFF